MEEATLREIAWIGDAVLALWARSWILQQAQIKPEQRSDVFVSMTSNRFLSAFGEPTAVEASIGKIFQHNGLEAACEWMDAELLPVFKKQLANAAKGKLGAKRKS